MDKTPIPRAGKRVPRGIGFPADVSRVGRPWLRIHSSIYGGVHLGPPASEQPARSYDLLQLLAQPARPIGGDARDAETNPVFCDRSVVYRPHVKLEASAFDLL